MLPFDVAGLAGGAEAETILAALLERVGRHRDRAAFARLFAIVAPRCKAWFLCRELSEAEAEELAQETLAAVWRAAPEHEPQRHGSAFVWLYMVGRDVWERARGDYVDRAAAEAACAARCAAAAEEAPRRAVRLARLVRAFAALPQQEALLLRDVFLHGLSHGAIARSRRMPLGTVKARIRRGTAKLRAAMAREEP